MSLLIYNLSIKHMSKHKKESSIAKEKNNPISLLVNEPPTSPSISHTLFVEDTNNNFVDTKEL